MDEREGFYEIESIRKKRSHKGNVQYLIKWLGWPESSNTWEPLENLISCSDMIDEFEERWSSERLEKQRLNRKGKGKQVVSHQPQETKKKHQPDQQQQGSRAANYVTEELLPNHSSNDPACSSWAERNADGMESLRYCAAVLIDRAGQTFKDLSIKHMFEDQEKLLSTSNEKQG